MVTQVVGASSSGVLGEIQFRPTSVRSISGVRDSQGSRAHSGGKWGFLFQLLATTRFEQVHVEIKYSPAMPAIKDRALNALTESELLPGDNVTRFQSMLVR